MQDWLSQLGLMDLHAHTIAIRLIFAMVCGGILGIGRTRKLRAAGMRTYMLVCIGAAIVMMTGQFMATFYEVDPSRMGAQVISGIGFLGAGSIMVTRFYRVKGLTTAAGLWVAACTGLAIGIGFYLGAFMTCFVLLAVLTFADRLESAYIKRLNRIHLFLILRGIEDIKPLLSALKANGMQLSDLETAKSDGQMGIGLFCTLRIPSTISQENAIQMVENAEGVLFAEETSD